MQKTLLAVTLSGLIASAAPSWLNAKTIKYQLPPETVQLKPGPNLQAAQSNCTACHSSDYIRTQPPQDLALKKQFWQTEVTKMIKLYGAPIDDADVPKIIEYLAGTY